MKKVELDLKNIKVNYFVILEAFRNQAKKQQWTEQEIEFVIKEATGDTYEHILKTIKKYCKNAKNI